jgi:hypothetical protein
MRSIRMVGVLFALSLPVFAQTVGQITGEVTDPSGAIAAGATVTKTNSQTNVVFDMARNLAGRVNDTSGDPGRNVVIGAPLFTVDSSHRKDMNFTERLDLQLRLDVFNMFNHPNVGDAGNSLTADQLDGNGVPIPGTGGFGGITCTKSGVAM